MQLKYVQLISGQWCPEEVILEAKVSVRTYHLRTFLRLHAHRQIHIRYIWQMLDSQNRVTSNNSPFSFPSTHALRLFMKDEPFPRVVTVVLRIKRCWLEIKRDYTSIGLFSMVLGFPSWRECLLSHQRILMIATNAQIATKWTNILYRDSELKPWLLDLCYSIMGNGENTKLFKKIGGLECKVLEIICKEIKTKRDHITCSSHGNRSSPQGSGDQTPSPLLLELYDPISLQSTH